MFNNDMDKAAAEEKADANYKTASWWMILITATMAVPAFAVILASMTSASGTSEIVIFIAACWMCIYLGLKLVKHPKVAPRLFERVSISEPARQRCVEMVGTLETEVAKWKKRYDKCEPAFMGLSKDPVWGYIDEVSEILTNIRLAVTKEANVPVPQVKSLNNWATSSKPKAIAAYIQALRSMYPVSKSTMAAQGKNIDELYPDFGNGNMDALTNAPTALNNYAAELMETIKKEHPLMGTQFGNASSKLAA